MSNKGVAIVTGASQGIGRAIALRLADDGFDVAINDLASAKEKLETLHQEIVSKGRKSHICIADVVEEDQVAHLVDEAVKELGDVEVMVANAGITLMKPLLDTTVQDLDKILAINVRGVFLCYKYAAKRMIEQGKGGRLIGASSGVAKQGRASLSAYSASKFAVSGLTQSCADELGPHGITVNAYAPGAIETPMLHSLSEHFGSWESLVAAESARLPVRFIGNPNDVAGLVSFLASKESRFITGQSMSINGGYFFD